MSSQRIDFAEMNGSAFLNQYFAYTVEKYLIFRVLVGIREYMMVSMSFANNITNGSILNCCSCYHR